ncbi:unnamed protein product [Ascophyllum nodosum]
MSSRGCSSGSPSRTNVWKRSGLEHFQQFPQENGAIFLFNAYTGEAIYDVDRWGSPLPGARRFSHWFEPTDTASACSDLCSSGPSSITNQRNLLDDPPPGNDYRMQWHAAEIIQRNLRSALARWRVARALCFAWTKHYDHMADRYAFTHSSTGAIQYHKPWGMGTADLWASPGDKVDQALLSLFVTVESTTNSRREDNKGEDVRRWEGSRRQRQRLYRFYRERNFRQGPYCRICGPGRTKEISLTNVFLYPKKYFKVRPFAHPRDMQFEGTRMGNIVSCMDGLVEKTITVDPYFHVRNASEHGAMKVLEVMNKYGNNLHVQGVGLQRMAGSLLEDDGTGGVTEGQKKYLAKALELLRSHLDVEWIQAEACAAIASMSSEVCIRKQMEREHVEWLEDVVAAMMNVKVVTRMVKEIDHLGKESIRYEEKVPSRMAPLIALHGCRILANMACDERNRVEVAGNSISAVIHVARFIADGPVLVCAVSAAIYNFVSRQETAHEMVVEAGAREVLEGMLGKLEPHDKQERVMVTRALATLEPHGWRGVNHGQ